VAENLCLRQQLLVLQRRHPQPRLRDKDRRFWILASRWCPHWRKSLLVVTPGTVMAPKEVESLLALAFSTHTTIRTPFRSPQANAIAERWVRSVRNDCLDYLLILNERHLRRVLVEYVAYFNHWRPHRSVGRRTPCALAPPLHHWDREDLHVVAKSVLGGLHHVYDLAV
jgi:hypothetical protein